MQPYAKKRVYLGINKIGDPALRAMVYEIFEANWNSFYDKTIVGIADKFSGRTGATITERYVTAFELIKPAIPEIYHDVLYTLCYIAPVWIGDTIFKEPGAGRVHLKSYDIWRKKDWEDYQEKWWKDEIPRYMALYMIRERYSRYIKIVGELYTNPSRNEFETDNVLTLWKIIEVLA